MLESNKHKGCNHSVILLIFILVQSAMIDLQLNLLLFHAWQAEINYLSELHHPNLVRLVGYCIEDAKRLLVYEYMSQGSLDNHLFKSMS